MVAKIFLDVDEYDRLIRMERENTDLKRELAKVRKTDQSGSGPSSQYNGKKSVEKPLTQILAENEAAVANPPVKLLPDITNAGEAMQEEADPEEESHVSSTWSDERKRPANRSKSESLEERWYLLGIPKGNRSK